MVPAVKKLMMMLLLVFPNMISFTPKHPDVDLKSMLCWDVHLLMLFRNLLDGLIAYLQMIISLGSVQKCQHLGYQNCNLDILQRRKLLRN